MSYIPNGAKPADAAAIVTTKSMRPEQITTWELGYKGRIGKKLYVDINAYYGNSKHFLSPAISVAGRVLRVGEIPVSLNTLAVPGIVNEAGILNGAAFSTYFNYGQVASYGLDLGLDYQLAPHLKVALKYSWFGSDITRNNIKNDANGDGSLEERSLNAPGNRMNITFSSRNLIRGKAFVNLSARWVEQFDMYSGSQIAT